MKLLRIAGNALLTGALRNKAIIGCCNVFWKDSFLWDDLCSWKEPDCEGGIWVNSEIWENECPWT